MPLLVSIALVPSCLLAFVVRLLLVVGPFSCLLLVVVAPSLSARGGGFFPLLIACGAHTWRTFPVLIDCGGPLSLLIACGGPLPLLIACGGGPFL